MARVATWSEVRNSWTPADVLHADRAIAAWTAAQEAWQKAERPTKKEE